MAHSFITNKDRLLSDIITGILPKSDAVDILVWTPMMYAIKSKIQFSPKKKSKNRNGLSTKRVIRKTTSSLFRSFPFLKKALRRFRFFSEKK